MGDCLIVLWLYCMLYSLSPLWLLLLSLFGLVQIINDWLIKLLASRLLLDLFGVVPPMASDWQLWLLSVLRPVHYFASCYFSVWCVIRLLLTLLRLPVALWWAFILKPARHNEFSVYWWSLHCFCTCICFKKFVKTLLWLKLHPCLFFGGNFHFFLL